MVFVVYWCGKLHCSKGFRVVLRIVAGCGMSFAGAFGCYGGFQWGSFAIIGVRSVVVGAQGGLGRVAYAIVLGPCRCRLSVGGGGLGLYMTSFNGQDLGWGLLVCGVWPVGCAAGGWRMYTCIIIYRFSIYKSISTNFRSIHIF